MRPAAQHRAVADNVRLHWPTLPRRQREIVTAFQPPVASATWPAASSPLATPFDLCPLAIRTGTSADAVAARISIHPSHGEELLKAFGSDFARPL